MKRDSIAEKRPVCLLKHLLVMALLIVSFPFCQTKAQPKVVINEAMQSNVDFMMMDHDFPDSWVELYNGSDTRRKVNNSRSVTAIYDVTGKRLQNMQNGLTIIIYADGTRRIISKTK